MSKMPSPAVKTQICVPGPREFTASVEPIFKFAYTRSYHFLMSFVGIGKKSTGSKAVPRNDIFSRGVGVLQVVLTFNFVPKTCLHNTSFHWPPARD